MKNYTTPMGIQKPESQLTQEKDKTSFLCVAK